MLKTLSLCLYLSFGALAMIIQSTETHPDQSVIGDHALGPLVRPPAPAARKALRQTSRQEVEARRLARRDGRHARRAGPSDVVSTAGYARLTNTSIISVSLVSSCPSILPHISRT